MSQSATHFNTIQSIAFSILAIAIISNIVQGGNCHISSVLSGAGHDGKAPLSLSHIRLSRGPSTPSVPNTDEEEGSSTSRLHFLKPPTYQHKYLQRLSQFHGNDRGFGNFPIVDVSGYTNGVWTDNNAANQPESDGEQEEAFSPYIGARALSNIPEFFQHLKANIEALQKGREESKENTSRNDHSHKYDESSERRVSLDEPWFPTNEENANWNPVSSNRYRTFHHQPLDRPRHNYNPSWQYTNLGLGRRR